MTHNGKFELVIISAISRLIESQISKTKEVFIARTIFADIADSFKFRQILRKGVNIEGK